MFPQDACEKFVTDHLLQKGKLSEKENERLKKKNKDKIQNASY